MNTLNNTKELYKFERIHNEYQSEGQCIVILIEKVITFSCLLHHGFSLIFLLNSN